MKTMKSTTIVALMMLCAGQGALATGSHNPPPPVTPTPTPSPTTNVPVTQNTSVDLSAYQEVNVGVKVPVHVSTPVDVHTGDVKVPVTINQGSTTIEGSRADATLNVGNGALSPRADAVGIAGDVNVEGATIEKGAIENHVTGGQGGLGGTGGSVTLASGAIAPRTGDVNNKVEVVDNSKNINVTLVPPGLPSLAPAPMIAECANCYIDYMYSILETCGATTQTVEVFKGKDLPVAKDVFVTMTTLANFPGIRKKKGNGSVVAVIANSVPEDTYECIAMVTVQAAGKDGHMLTPDELRIRAAQAGQFLVSTGNDRPLYLVLSRKATIQHATLVTTGKGWSVAPGGGGLIGNAVGSVTGTIGRSSGTATNDWTPEITGILIRPKSGQGVTPEALGRTEYSSVETSVTVAKQ